MTLFSIEIAALHIKGTNSVAISLRLWHGRIKWHPGWAGDIQLENFDEYADFRFAQQVQPIDDQEGSSGGNHTLQDKSQPIMKEKSKRSCTTL